MKSLFKAIFMVLLATALITSCSKTKEPEDDINAKDPPQSNGEADAPQKEISVSGRVITVTYNSTGLAEFILMAENGTLYRIIPENPAANEVSVGQQATAKVKGSVMEADPMQAIAEGLETTEAFKEEPLPSELYTVYGITATKISEALNSLGYRFLRFTNYGECLNFLSENDLSAEFKKAVGDTDISALTEAFFRENDLGIFIINHADDRGNEPEGLFHSDRTLYLKISRTTKNPVFINDEFDIVLFPLNKTVEITQGIVLTEQYLEPYYGE